MSVLTPWRVDIPVWAHLRHVSATQALNFDSSGYTLASSDNWFPAKYATLAWEVVLGAGTWRLTALYEKNNVSGIADFRLDGVSVGTIDFYNATTQYNQRSQLTGITVGADGPHQISVFVHTKSGSSTNYQILLNWITLTRTA